MCEVMPFGFPDHFEIAPLAPSQSVTGWNAKPKFEDNEENKKTFGVELAKNENAFKAACEVFKETNVALWVSTNWINDPIVTASRDLYLKTLKTSSPILDKDTLAATVLALAEEKITLANGTEVYVCDAKDRIAALKLYSEIAGYTGKVNIDNSTKNFTHNEMLIRFVKPEPKNDIKTIDNSVNDSQRVEPLPLKLKLVK